MPIEQSRLLSLILAAESFATFRRSALEEASRLGATLYPSDPAEAFSRLVLHLESLSVTQRATEIIASERARYNATAARNKYHRDYQRRRRSGLSKESTPSAILSVLSTKSLSRAANPPPSNQAAPADNNTQSPEYLHALKLANEAESLEPNFSEAWSSTGEA